MLLEGSISLPKAFSLAQEGVFLAFEEVGRYSEPTLLRERSSSGHRTRAFAKPPNQCWRDVQYGY